MSAYIKYNQKTKKTLHPKYQHRNFKSTFSVAGCYQNLLLREGGVRGMGLSVFENFVEITWARACLVQYTFS